MSEALRMGFSGIAKGIMNLRLEDDWKFQKQTVFWVGKLPLTSMEVVGSWKQYVIWNVTIVHEWDKTNFYDYHVECKNMISKTKDNWVT